MIETCAEQTVWCLQHREETRALAARGREHVRKRFLLTQPIADDLLGAGLRATLPVAQVGLAGKVRDLVCGMRVNPHKAPSAEYGGRRFHFCSTACQRQFQDAPNRFMRTESPTQPADERT